jgi:Carbohydrate family 9 binding domain-like
MMRTVWMLSLVCVGCAKHEDPTWAQMPATGTSGDSTIDGSPLRIPRFPAAPKLDGKLDDAVWAHAATTAAFVQPGDGSAAPRHDVAAFAKLGWDREKLYVGVLIFDRSPFSPFTREDVDPHDWEKSSALEIMAQPGTPSDNRDYYEMQFDVHGAIFDTHWDDYNTPITTTDGQKVFGHPEWSCKAERAVYVEPDHFYSMEIAIPWNAFVPGRFAIPPRAGDTWRLNLYSFKDSQRLSLAWSPIRGQGNFHKSARFGRITFAAE